MHGWHTKTSAHLCEHARSYQRKCVFFICVWYNTWLHIDSFEYKSGEENFHFSNMVDFGGFSADTISIAMTAAPKSIPVLNSIYSLAIDIRETSQRVKANKEDCEKLSERIETLIGFITQGDLSDGLNEPMQRALCRFEEFLGECLRFIDTFVEATRFRNIISSSSDEKKISWFESGVNSIFEWSQFRYWNE